MARSQADLLALKAELTNDPLALGLTVLAADDEANANKLNLIRETIQINRTQVSPSEVKRAINRVEYNAATLADRQWIDMQTSGDLIDTSPGEVRTGLLGIFGANTATRANLNALLTESGNRIEQLFQAGTLEAGGFVTPSDVAQARQAS